MLHKTLFFRQLIFVAELHIKMITIYRKINMQSATRDFGDGLCDNLYD